MAEQATPTADAALQDAPATTEQQPDSPAQDSTDWKAEARKWEDRSKANAQAAKELKAAQARLKAFEDANLSETEKLTQAAQQAAEQAEQWRSRYIDTAKRQQIMQAAADAQSTDPETVYLYLNTEVTVDDDGNVAGVDKALANLQARKPHLFRTTPAGARDAAAGSPIPIGADDSIAAALKRSLGIN